MSKRSRRGFRVGFRTASASGGAPPAATRIIAALAADCVAVDGVMCGVCAASCEGDALRVHRLRDGRWLPVVYAPACTGCGACVIACPMDALALVHAAIPEPLPFA